MSVDWPVSAQEAAARLFAQALPTPLAQKPQNTAQNSNTNANFQNMVFNGQKVNEKTQNINIPNQNVHRNRKNITSDAFKNALYNQESCKNDRYQDMTGNSQNVPYNHQNMAANCQNIPKFSNASCQTQNHTYVNVNCQNDGLHVNCQNRSSDYDNINDQGGSKQCENAKNAWNGWLPCFENGKSDNNNVEEILIGADSEVRFYFIFVFKFATIKYFTFTPIT